MAVQTRNVLKTYFETGDKPTAAQFGDLIDSALTANTITTSETELSLVENTIYWCTVNGMLNVQLTAMSTGASAILNRYGSASVANSEVNFIIMGTMLLQYAAGYSDVSADATGTMSYAILVSDCVHRLKLNTHL